MPELRYRPPIVLEELAKTQQQDTMSKGRVGWALGASGIRRHGAEDSSLASMILRVSSV
jgi:hypothetical protein